MSSGVQQGDSSSSTIFAFFINDLICGLNDLNKGVAFGENKLCCLAYADDVLLLAESENDMQDLLNFVNEWCRKWRLIINFSKTNAMHFRNKGKRCSNFDFKVGNHTVDYVSVYRYLGVHLNEHMYSSISNPSCARYWIKNSGKIPYHCNLYPFCIKTVLIFQILFTCIN